MQTTIETWGGDELTVNFHIIPGLGATLYSPMEAPELVIDSVTFGDTGTEVSDILWDRYIGKITEACWEKAEAL